MKTANEHDLEHLKQLKKLLALEGDAEAQWLRDRLKDKTAASAEQSGYSLCGLRLDDLSGGLAGRTLLTFKKRSQAPLPWTTLRVGSPVLLRRMDIPDDRGYRALVSSLTSLLIQIALEADVEDWDDEAPYRLDAAPDEVTRIRQVATLTLLEGAQLTSRDPVERRRAELRETLLGRRAPTTSSEETAAAISPSLNTSQKEAVIRALRAQDLAIIHGPPGTGKTTTIAELIRLSVARGEKVLVSAASNLAVDNVLSRVLNLGVPALRLGHPARISPELRAHTLDYMVEEHEDFRLARDYRRQAQKLLHLAGRYTRARPEPGAKAEKRREARDLMKIARHLEAQAVSRLLDTTPVIGITATAVSTELLGDRYFDRVVFDEAGQATEPATWIPLLWGRAVVLAGDHQQLPPTVISQAAAHQGLARSLMERLVGLYGDTVTHLLREQYRMNTAIMAFSAQEYYQGRLEAAAMVAHHRLADLPEVQETPEANMSVVFLDTAGAGFDEETDSEGESRLNRGEATLVAALVAEHLAMGLDPKDLGIISPYAAQVRHLRSIIDTPGLEIESIDGFQGREKELIIISLVRSNDEGTIGFLTEGRRLNVALTRARRKLVVVGDSATLARHDLFARFLDHVAKVGVHQSVWERMTS